MSRLCIVVCIIVAGLRADASHLRINLGTLPRDIWFGKWYGPDHFGVKRAAVEHRLEKLSGNQLVLVRYPPSHDPGYDWVYNAADVDHARVIWARDMGLISNQELINYYKDRHVWLIEPDAQPVKLTPYPLPSQQVTAAQ